MFYNSKSGHTEGHGKVKIIDHKEKRTITGEEVIYNANTGHSEGHGNVKIVDELKQRTITGDNLLYNSKTHVGEGKGNVDYIDYKSKHAFKGDYIHYTDTAAIAYGGKPGPVAKDFSKGNDTLFVHADTITMKAFNFNTPQVYRKILVLIMYVLIVQMFKLCVVYSLLTLKILAWLCTKNLLFGATIGNFSAILSKFL